MGYYENYLNVFIYMYLPTNTTKQQYISTHVNVIKSYGLLQF